MAPHSVAEIAHRAGLTQDRVEEFVAAGVLPPRDDGSFDDRDVRRAVCITKVIDAGVSLEALARGVADGTISFGFLDGPEYERLAATTDETFGDVAQRTGIPLELLCTLREAIGSPTPSADSYIRENELEAVPYLELAITEGFSVVALERQLRVAGDGLRRLAETEADTWYREILAPRVAQGLTGYNLAPESGERLASFGDQMVLAIHHGRQANAWLGNVVNGFSTQLARAGLHAPRQASPTICFLDITGYTRMTAERGDSAAAQLAENLSRIVQRTANSYAGKPVKWLGDGVMVYFDHARDAVVAALEMLTALPAAGMPPAHVGIHTGEVHFNQGDYFGRTVNLASRIAEYARAGEVLVSADVATAASDVPEVRFDEIGPVDLKGVDGPVTLFAVRPAAAAP